MKKGLTEVKAEIICKILLVRVIESFSVLILPSGCGKGADLITGQLETKSWHYRS